jgi:ApaG protein
MKIQNNPLIKFDVECIPHFVSEESKPEDSYYFFSYKVKLKNQGSEPVQLMSRHWVITDALGRTEEVRGPGVVGLQPKIQPGQSFEYESACPLNTSTGSMKGTYSMVTDNGHNFEIQIPEFYLICPNSLH